jgi:predicted regulator of Ras-like GTPase activity (Roadblock/LC7/MglB family)
MIEMQYAGAPSSTSLDWLLTNFARQVPDIVHALTVSTDGLRLATSEHLSIDLADQLAAVMSGLASLTTGAARCLSTGQVRQTIVDMDHGTMLIMIAGDRALVGVVAAPGCDLGQVGYETAMLVQRVADALEPGVRR